MTAKCALVMAGGTGGHIFPGLAVAQALRERGWRVHWLGGAPGAQGPSMESQLVPPRGFPFEAVEFSGVRGKGLLTLVRLPLRLLRAFAQSFSVLRRVRPDVVVGLGGYITFPAGLMAALLGIPLLLHEQNSVAGMANRLLARLARRVLTAFPDVLKGAQWVGNPLRSAFTTPCQTVAMLPTMVAPTSTSANGPSAESKMLTTRSLRANSPGTPRAVVGLTENNSPGT